MAFKNTGVQAPGELRTEGFLLRPITAADNELDYAAVMDSRESLRLWEGSTWPEDDFTPEANLKDMEQMAQRHLDGYAFGFTMMNLDETECLGCVYIFATDAKMYANTVATPLIGGATWDEYDTTIHFWVRESRIESGLDIGLLAALDSWMKTAWNVAGHVFVTSEQFAQQVAMIEASGLQKVFRLANPDESTDSLAFA